ncbi:MAG: hypothetical protein IJ408_00810 [Clostridia bacterium]|nr:hypothetical protein [Clostridia bacterium]
MKRSIISLTVFCLLIAIGVYGEGKYTRELASSIDACIQEDTQVEQRLDELFKRRSILNRIFLKEGIIERFETHIEELKVYSKYGMQADRQAALEKIKYYNEDLKNGRAY